MADCTGHVLFYVQHLLGVGHLFRAQRIGEELVRAGLSVTFVVGGVPVPGLVMPGESTVFLPPVQSADAAFSRMTDGEGNDLTPDYMGARARALIEAFAAADPDIVVIEAFPFGRRFLRAEMLGLLDAARRRDEPPIVCCSVRDILQENRKPGRAEEAASIIETYFDMVLVHGDPAMVRLEATFPAADRIADKIRYTGIVAGPPRPLPAMPRGQAEPAPKSTSAADVPVTDILVSAGGGAFGARLLNCAAEAAVGDNSGRRWLLVTGPNADPVLGGRLREKARQRVKTAIFLPDLPAHLAQTGVSVSQAGYNTVADLLGAPCKRVLVPSDAGGQTEQGHRARLLARAGFAVCLPESELTAARLLSAIGEARLLPEPEVSIDLGGAPATARILCEALTRRRISEMT